MQKYGTSPLVRLFTQWWFKRKLEKIIYCECCHREYWPYNFCCCDFDGTGLCNNVELHK